MKKVKTNLWTNIIIFINFIGVISTGILLHRFPSELKERTIMGVNRYDWGDLHWVLALSLIFFTVVHLVLHWDWVKGSLKKYLGVGKRSLTIAVIVITVSGFLIPYYLTRDFPDRKEFKDMYLITDSFEVEKTGAKGVGFCLYKGL